jgi:hypothetical protein
MGNIASSLSSSEDPYVRAIKRPIKLTFVVELEFIIHVSNGSKKGFDLQTLKTLAGLIVGFEPQINSLHPTHRCTPNSWCTPLSHTCKFRALAPLQRVELIERTTSLSSFLALFGVTSDIAVNFLNLKRATRTIEFRQHEGTLNEERVASWVVLVTSLVTFAHEMLPSVYIKLVGSWSCWPGWGWRRRQSIMRRGCGNMPARGVMGGSAGELGRVKGGKNN